MRPLTIVIRLFCLLPFLTGTLDLVGGAGFLKRGGVPMPDSLTRDPVLNSQIGFWGAIWLGFGLTLWRTSADPRANSALFRLLMGILFLSGLGRASAAIRFGPPGRPMTGAMALELVGPPLLLSWHHLALRNADRT